MMGDIDFDMVAVDNGRNSCDELPVIVLKQVSWPGKAGSSESHTISDRDETKFYCS